jgi:hypothetical protein
MHEKAVTKSIERDNELDFYRRELRRQDPRLVEAHERNRPK